ncbi:polysaccharide deacetylase family protein [Actinomadura sp. DC4]|uniref:polysaccharide deacetylase family protein n=1 Tax=Actinomadura sp. DC4 TaxID=3055069 RepID=UPI0025B11A77|nr:polysaccharide deacetylase family protein [Actinomadura sp. DC4]MDN3358293.1 polysaccharide deacetylase family protein [Actinomadura sp. DC4]
MRFAIPAGRARLWAAAVAGVLVLGWLSGVGPVGANGGQASTLASGRSAIPASGHGRGHTARRKPVAKHPEPVDCRAVKCVALTFDDGPGPYTTKLLGMLAARHARVTFFLIGGNIQGREAIVRKELAEGHAIGDHTWSHPDLSTLPKQAVRAQLTRTLTEIAKVTGGPTRLMRPPYGATDRSVGTVARTLGLSQITWSVDTDDWRDRNSAIVAQRAITRARRGDIILMHDIHPTTVNAVPRILRGLAKRGFTFATVPELLAARPLRPGTLYFHEGPIKTPRTARSPKRTTATSRSCTRAAHSLRCALAKRGFAPVRVPEQFAPQPLKPGNDQTAQPAQP